jgi:hypothetical protein
VLKKILRTKKKEITGLKVFQGIHYKYVCSHMLLQQASHSTAAGAEVAVTAYGNHSVLG